MFDFAVLLLLASMVFMLMGISGSLRMFLNTPIQVVTAAGEPEIVHLWSNPSPGEQVIVRDAATGEYIMCEIAHVVENPDKSFTWDVNAIEDPPPRKPMERHNF